MLFSHPFHFLHPRVLSDSDPNISEGRAHVWCQKQQKIRTMHETWKLMVKEVNWKQIGREEVESHGASGVALVSSTWTHSWGGHSRSDGPSQHHHTDSPRSHSALWSLLKGCLPTWPHLILAMRNPGGGGGGVRGGGPRMRAWWGEWGSDKGPDTAREWLCRIWKWPFLQTVSSKTLTQMYSSCYYHENF